jgi:hypothetical protein
MSIWMITREFEYESAGGRTWYEPMAAVDLGYFISKEAAELKLADVRDEEKDAHRRNWERTTHQQWVLRKANHDRIVEQNRILVDHGVAPSSLTAAPHVWEEPVYRPWTPEMSSYSTIEIEEGAV